MVTLIPPAVEVGPPPITISAMYSNEVESCSPAISVVAKPAVRGVTP